MINDLSSKSNNSLENIFPPIGENRQNGSRRHQRNGFARLSMVLEVSFREKSRHRVRVRIPKLLTKKSWKCHWLLDAFTIRDIQKLRKFVIDKVSAKCFCEYTNPCPQHGNSQADWIQSKRSCYISLGSAWAHPKTHGIFQTYFFGQTQVFKINLFGSYLDRPRSWSDLLFRSDSLKHLASATMPFGLVSRVSTETRLKGSFQNCKQWKNTSKQERSSRWIRPTDSGYFLDQPLCQDSASRFQGPGGFMRYRKVLWPQITAA